MVEEVFDKCLKGQMTTFTFTWLLMQNLDNS